MTNTTKEPQISDLITYYARQSSEFITAITKASIQNETKLNEANSQIETLDSEVTDLQSKIQEESKLKDKLSIKLKESTTQLTIANETIEKIRKDFEITKTNLDQSIQIQSQLEQDHYHTNQLLFEATDSLAIKEQDVIDLTGALTEAVEKIHEWESQALEWSTSAEAWVKERLTLQEKCETFQTKVLDMDTELSVLREETSRQVGTIQDLELEVQRAETYQSQLDEVQQKLTETESSLAQSLARESKLDLERKTLETLLAEKDQYINRADHELQILQQAKTDTENELIRVTNVSADMDQDRSHLELKCQQLEQQVRTFSETIEILTNQVDEDKCAYQKLALDLSDKDKQLESLKSQLIQNSTSLQAPSVQFQVPNCKGPSSVVSTASHLYETMAKFGIKPKSPNNNGTALNLINGSKRSRLNATTAVSRLNQHCEGLPIVPNDSVSVVGMDILPEDSAVAWPASRKSIQGNTRKSVVVTFSGFRESLPPYQISTKGELVQVVEKLNGGVLNASDAFDSTVTHVVTPPNTRTFKTLAAALCHRWLIYDVNWVLESGKAGKFLPPDRFGKRYFSVPFNGKVVCITDKFREESKVLQFRIDNAIKLIETYGKGSVSSDSQSSDIVLTSAADTTQYSCLRLDWIAFIKLIMPHEDYAINGVPEPES